MNNKIIKLEKKVYLLKDTPPEEAKASWLPRVSFLENLPPEEDTVIPYLPLEILSQIASSGSPQLWYNMALALPPLGRYSLRSHVQKRMKSKFVKKITEPTWDGVRVMSWRLPGGKLHSPNDDQPAWIRYHENGESKEWEGWYKDGKLHRENDHPARIEYYENGFKMFDFWYKDGKRHRENDPAWIVYYFSEGGSKKFELWYRDGEKHRENDQPACIEYSEDGSKRSEEWFKDGKFIK